MTARRDYDGRLEQILEVLRAIARRDFGARVSVSGSGDVVDAIATTLNGLSDELAAEVASRRELERAHSELKQAEARAVHAGKLAAVGQLSTGIAHEINNPATSLEAALAIIQRACDEIGPTLPAPLAHTRQAVADAQEAVARIRRLTGDLKTFARTDDEPLRPVRLDEIAGVSCRLVAPMVRHRAELVVELTPVPPILGNRGRLSQVVTNLLVNAAQAVPERAPAEQVVALATRAEGDRVLLTVDDSGPGVPPALRDKIFEPFFTTKPEGIGTGLGLSLVAEIVAAHGGTVDVSDGPRGGARFELSFPAAAGAEAPSSSPPVSVEPVRARVLLVDDEAMIVRLLTALLKDACEVVSATSGGEAVALLERDRNFDAILCDLHMREVDGIDVYHTVRRLEPALIRRFVFTTGGAVTQRGRDFLDSAEVRVLPKPFRTDDLFAIVRELAALRRAQG